MAYIKDPLEQSMAYLDLEILMVSIFKEALTALAFFPSLVQMDIRSLRVGEQTSLNFATNLHRTGAKVRQLRE